MNFNYRSTENLLSIAKLNLRMIPEDIDVVVGIPRSGLFLANILALYLNKPFADLDGFLEKRHLGSGIRRINNSINIKKILVVDDSVWSGTQITEAKQKLKNYNSSIQIVYLTAYINPEKKDLVDVYFEKLAGPRIFEWNILNSWIYSISCTDLDGILCVDPQEIDNDDGERYLKFIRTTSPKFIPHAKIKTIVTARLEKYRAPTVDWLSKNLIEYENLIMMNLPDKAARIKAGNHASFKAEVYKNSDAEIFIESAKWQALEINKLSNKAVFCSENMQMYLPIHLPDKDSFRTYLKNLFFTLKYK